MPVEIRELVIKASVDESNPAPAAAPGQDQEALIAECVARVMQLLRDDAER